MPCTLGASTVEETDWVQIVVLYDQLLAIAPTPVVAMNRAIAVGEVQGPAAALALVDALDAGQLLLVSTPHGLTFSRDWAGIVRPRTRTNVAPHWRQRSPSGSF